LTRKTPFTYSRAPNSEEFTKASGFCFLPEGLLQAGLYYKNYDYRIVEGEL